MRLLGKYALNRRTLLRGALGGAIASIALPPLEAMLNTNGDSYANGQPIPKRFGLFFWGNGVILNKWKPSGIGRDNAWSLSQELQPLADVKDYLTVISGHDIKNKNQRGHHDGVVGMFSGTDLLPRDPGGANYASTFRRQTIDQLIAERINHSPFRSLEVGVDARVTTGEGTTLRYLSHNGPDSANPPEYDPRKIFNKLFGNGFVEPGGEVIIDPAMRVRKNILDAVQDDVKDLQKRLGVRDRMRLEDHLTGINELQRRIQGLIDATPPTAPMCMKPAAPGDPGGFDSPQQRTRSRVIADLLAMAMICDQVRVWSNLYSGSVSGTNFTDIHGNSFHNLTHEEGSAQDRVHEIVVFIMQEFNYMLNRFKQLEEGDGNLLDNTLVLASSDVTSGLYHTKKDYPILLAGKAGGAIRGNQHFQKSGENSTNVLMTCTRAMDLPINEIGEGGCRSSNHIPEIMM